MACLAFCLAGCVITPTDDSEPAAAPVSPPATNSVVRPKPPAPVKIAPPIVRQYTNIYRPNIQLNNPPPVIVKTAPPAPALTWTSLDQWATTHGVGAPHRLSVSPVVSYAIGSQHGVMVVDIGSRDATWNGIQVHLGFAPEFIDDQIFVHGLDLQKNFAPLLCEAPSLPELHHIIVIDPGHGGMNGGTISVLPGHRPEKTFTLDWARRLAPLLEAQGWQVYLTRTNDTDVAITNRVNFAVTHGADLFISLHFNSAGSDQRQAGLETYCITPTGMPSTITRDYADLVSRSFPANAYDRESLWLALRLHNAILHATSEEDRGVRRARFLGVLQGEHCPAVLIEGGYLSNPHEAALIENGEYRQKLAEAVANALR